MNCFEWESHSSDYIDDMLPIQSRKNADQHLVDCLKCRERLRHYRLIISTISNQPRSELPDSIRRSPFRAGSPKSAHLLRHSRWEKTPWYIRSGIEGLGIAFLILFVVAAIPKIRTLYQENMGRLETLDMEKLATEFETNTDPEALEKSLPLLRGKSDVSENTANLPDDFYGEEEVPDETEIPVANADFKIKVGKSEVWRFNLKTDSPRQLRPTVINMLVKLGVAKKLSGLNGVEVPGGIQFDLLLSTQIIGQIKGSLERLSTPYPEAKGLAQETFTWYRIKARRKIPQGKARVVIWLSQI